jgi:hypothetical protein
MLTLDSINNHLDFYKSSENRWVRELYYEFEKYFDKYYLNSLNYLNFTEEDKKILIFGALQNLYLTISGTKYNAGRQKFSHNVLVLKSSNNPSNKDELSLNKDNVYILFLSLTKPWDKFIHRLLDEKVHYWEVKGDNSKRKEVLNISFHQGRIESAKRKQLENIIRIRKEEQRKDIENMSSMYIKACDKFINFQPTKLILQDFSGIDKDIWDSQLSNVHFLTNLTDEIKKKINQARKKEKKLFWKDAAAVIEQKIAILTKSSKKHRNHSFYNQDDSDLEKNI